jgi:hypothetical protein
MGQIQSSALGQVVFGVDLSKPTADEAILEAVVEQETIDIMGFITLWLKKNNNEAFTYRRTRVFDSRDAAVAFYNQWRPAYIKRDQLADECNSAIDALMAPIRGEPEFPHLAP